MDVTFATNVEDRPLFRLIGRTSENKNIPLMSAFMPSQCAWVFHWLFDEVIPSLFQDIRQLRLITTDEDRLQIRAFESLKTKYFPFADYRLCKFHKV